MKKPGVFAAVLCLSGLAINASAQMSLDATEQTSFDIGGSIAAECKVANTTTEQAASLDLSNASAQSAATISVWCNTGQNSADTTYSSANNGYLVNESGNQIAYNINVGDNASALSLSSPQTVQQASGTGVQGGVQSSNVAIIPQVSGFENSGSYSDTIAVTVSYN
ncbi:Csu type fimbrial protein [Planctobacterium marinum]|uniref:hypothetical protein n=1 Tax=Planctobacterium marinum TaxID=1631968 RepID=UPI001E361FD7|nr:hypothetical protein [Planctobacterium marinum]MCC2607278.1 hypothetical protein [Planctobacterium marinum]